MNITKSVLKGSVLYSTKLGAVFSHAPQYPVHFEPGMSKATEYGQAREYVGLNFHNKHGFLKMPSETNVHHGE